jgi:large subunit ribosomal protein L25
MERLQLKATVRDLEKTVPSKLRKSGVLPAVLYGHNIKNQSLSLKLAEFEKILRKAGESTIVDLVTEDGKTHSVLIHDVQNHYLTSTPIHVDFYEVSMTEKLKAKIILEFSGEPKAVKELGGVLMKNLSEVEVECLPADLPHSIPVDVSSLDSFQASILVKDLQVSSKVKIITSAEEVVAKVQPPRDVEAELAAPVVEDVSAVEGAAEIKPAAAEEASNEPQKESKKE